MADEFNDLRVPTNPNEIEKLVEEIYASPEFNQTDPASNTDTQPVNQSTESGMGQEPAEDEKLTFGAVVDDMHQRLVDQERAAATEFDPSPGALEAGSYPKDTAPVNFLGMLGIQVDSTAESNGTVPLTTEVLNELNKALVETISVRALAKQL